jgi:hypothetical protein
MNVEGEYGVKAGIQSKAGVNWNGNVDGGLQGMLIKSGLLNFER